MTAAKLELQSNNKNNFMGGGYHNLKNYISFWCFVLFVCLLVGLLWFFETGFLCVKALAVLELTL